MSEVFSSFRSLRAGSQVFALIMLFLCVTLHTMSSGKSLQLLFMLPFGMLFCTRVAWVCLVCLLLCKEEGSSTVSVQLLRGGYGPV